MSEREKANRFSCATRMRSADYIVARCLCPSVCPTYACILLKPLDIACQFLNRTKKYQSFISYALAHYQ